MKLNHYHIYVKQTGVMVLVGCDTDTFFLLLVFLPTSILPKIFSLLV